MLHTFITLTELAGNVRTRFACPGSRLGARRLRLAR